MMLYKLHVGVVQPMPYLYASVYNAWSNEFHFFQLKVTFHYLCDNYNIDIKVVILTTVPGHAHACMVL